MFMQRSVSLLTPKYFFDAQPPFSQMGADVLHPGNARGVTRGASVGTREPEAVTYIFTCGLSLFILTCKPWFSQGMSPARLLALVDDSTRNSNSQVGPLSAEGPEFARVQDHAGAGG